jgi:exosortase A-associated hydrolase 1
MMATHSAEKALTFDCQGDRLVGIAHAPGVPGDIGVVMVVGGPQYRVGSHRLFVRLARTVACAGFPVLRFDVRGMGDSTGTPLGFENIGEDVGAAIAALVANFPTVRRVVLWGLCDGAAAALLYVDATRDVRVHGLCLLNPWVRSPESLARTHVRHYYLQRLLKREFWAKLLSGKVALASIGSAFSDLRESFFSRGSVRQLGFRDRMARAWRAFPGTILLLVSGADYTAKEFVGVAGSAAPWKGALEQPNVTQHVMAGADHTLSDAAAEQDAERTLLHYLHTLAGAKTAAGSTHASV